MPRPKSTKNFLMRSYRVEDHIYNAARARATREGLSISKVIEGLVEGYARGVYELPKTVTVTKFPTK